MKECKMEQAAFQFPLLAVFTVQGWNLILKEQFCKDKNILQMGVPDAKVWAGF